jgi:hypothetical protein
LIDLLVQKINIAAERPLVSQAEPSWDTWQLIKNKFDDSEKNHHSAHEEQ